jgi:hypothetical protein
MCEVFSVSAFMVGHRAGRLLVSVTINGGCRAERRDRGACNT